MNLQSVVEQIKSQKNSPWKEIHERGFRYFSKHGLPSKKEEFWKYTGFTFLQEKQLVPVKQKSFKIDDLKESIGSYLNPDFYNFVYFDGNYVKEISDWGKVSEDLSDENCAGFVEQAKMLRKRVKVRQDSMEALNASFFTEAITLDFFKALKKPLQFIYFSSNEGATYPKLFLNIKSGVKLSLIETFVGGNANTFTNSVCEIHVDKGAELNFLRLQDQELDAVSVGADRIYLEEKSKLNFLSYSTGGKIARHNLDVYCLGEGIEAVINGLTMSASSQHMDNHTNIEHVVGNCNTTQLYKSILEDKSRVVFNGRVHIHPNAQKANSDQLNNNLLLSKDAEADSKPQLEIYADDVKATHGSTVGPLDPEELFYFQSRAVSAGQAMEMLSLGFVKELIDLFPEKSICNFLNRHLPAAYRRMKNHGN